MLIYVKYGYFNHLYINILHNYNSFLFNLFYFLLNIM